MFDTDIGIYGGLAILILILGIGLVLYFVLSHFLTKYYSIAGSLFLVGLVFVYLDIKLFYYTFLGMTFIFAILGLAKKQTILKRGE